jgi:hypothetical protein
LGQSARGATAGIEDVIGRDAGCFHLALVGLGQINVTSASQVKVRCDLGSDFVTARADARSHSSEEVGCCGFEISTHFVDGVLDDCGCRATPACMDGGDSAIPRVDQQYRDAIGRTNTDALADLVGDQRVTLTFTVLQARCIQNPIRVDLTECDINLRIRHTSSEAVFEPEELLEGATAIQAIAVEAE